MAELIGREDTLNEGREKINDSIKDSNVAKTDAAKAVTDAAQAKAQSTSTQEQLDNIIVESGTSDAEVVQARTDETGEGHATLKGRIDDGFGEVKTQLAETMNYLVDFGINVKSNGFKGDGTEEDTMLLNSIIQEVSERGGGTVYFPSQEDPYFIRVQTSVVMQSHVRLLLGIKAQIKATSTGNSAYSIILCRNIENFAIEGGVVTGERYEHIGESGEWGHGINLMGASNYEIKDILIEECWGDGMYVGPSSEITSSDNGHLERVRCLRNRRNGLSITSAKNLTSKDCDFDETRGADPQAGVDIEPNSHDDHIENIKFINPSTSNNERFGIVVALDKFTGSGNTVSISIQHHKDTGSGMNYSLAKSGGGFDGTVDNIEPRYFRAKENSVYVNNYSSDSAKVNVLNPYIKNPFEGRSEAYESGRYGNVVNIIRDSKGYAEGNIGNVNVTGLTVVEDEIKSFSSFGVWDDIGRAEDISFIDPLKLSNKKISNNKGLVEVTDKHKQLSLSLVEPGTKVLNNHNIVTYVDNRGADGTRLVALSQSLEVGTRIVFTVRAAHKLTISPPQGEQMRPLRTSWVEFNSDVYGSSIEIEKVTSTLWLIRNIIGVWQNLNDSI